MKKVKILLFVFLLVSLVVILGSNFASQAVSPSTSTIWLPRGHSPAFAEPGGTIKVEVESSVSLPTTGWTAQLQNDLKSWNATVNSVVTGSVHNGTKSGYIFTVTVPTDISPELFTLVLNDTVNGGSISSVRSVSIVPDFDASFYILHQSDEHIIGPNAVRPNGMAQLNWSTGSTEAKNWGISVINIINPRFVFATGDIVQLYEAFPGMDEAINRLNLYKNAMNNMTVPTVVMTGNHCIGYSSWTENAAWKAKYEELMGARVFSFRMGAFYVLADEWTQNTYHNWAVNDYVSSFGDSSIKYRLVGSHYYDAGWTAVPTAQYPCELMLVGHNHSISTIQTSPFRVLSTASALDYQLTGFFNFQKSGSTWVCPQATSRTNGVDYFQLHGDWGANKKVTATYAYSNDGTRTSNSVTINNAIAQRFYDGRIRFLMSKGVYTVNGGTILAQYDYGANSTAVVVKVDIMPSTATNVSITQVLTNPVYGNRVKNPGFEEDGAWAATPKNWSTSGSTPAADFAESGGAHGGNYLLKHWNANAYQVYTYQTITNLPNGVYTLKAWVISSGGQSACYLNAKDYGDSELRVNLPNTFTWTQIEIPNIKVSNGQCTIGLYSNAGADKFCAIDDVEFYCTDLMLNGSFEDDGAWAATPKYWNTSGSTPLADFAEAGGARTGNYILKHWNANAYQVYTYQTKTNLENGYYTLKAWVKSSGGQNSCYMNAKDFGGTERKVNLPTTHTWTQITITNINVTNGQCTFGFYSDSTPDKYCIIDDVEFIKQ